MSWFRYAAGLACLAVMIASCGPASATSFTASQLRPDADGWRGIALPHDRLREMPDVTLEDVDGGPVRLSDAFAGTPTLLFFGYTSCPDVCPIHLGTITSAMDVLGISTEQLAVAFVSVDPERDTRARIREFVGAFDGGIVGLRGATDDVEAALARLDLPGPTVEGPDPRGDGHLVGHPAQVIGFDADGRARRVWPFGARRADWVADLPRILDEWSVTGVSS